jgi:small-conductance mechanosensitive channel
MQIKNTHTQIKGILLSSILMILPKIQYAQKTIADNSVLNSNPVLSEEIKQYIIAGSILIFSIICGLVFKKVIVHRLRKHTKRTNWQGDDIILNGLNRAAIPIFMVVGIYIAVHNLPLDKSVIQILDIISVVIILLTATIVAGRIAAGFVTNYTRRNNGLLPATSLFSNITKIVVFIIGGLIILQFVGISITPILTALGVGGLAVALALQDTLSNLFSGLNIIASKQIKPGDFIKLDNQEEGLVTDITWRYTTIKAMPNNRIIVPNFKLASAIITNYNLPQEDLTVSIPVHVSYNSDLDFVEKVTLEVANHIQQTTEGAVKEHVPAVSFKEFGPSGIHFSVVLRAKDFNAQFLLKHHFIKKLHEEYSKNKIEIPFQTITVINNQPSN